jgi:hypothetical protein
LLCDLPIVNVCLAGERARRGDRDNAIPLMRAAVDHLFREGRLLAWGVPATGVLVETLLDRGSQGDVGEAEAAIERLAAAPADDGVAVRDIWLLRLRALLARAHGDSVAYADFRDAYRDMARTLGFEARVRDAVGRTTTTRRGVCSIRTSGRRTTKYGEICRRQLNTDQSAATEN